jgi:hypothetical protein
VIAEMGATQLSESKTRSEVVLLDGLDSPWLSAQAHHEGLRDYIPHLSALFVHHSHQNTLRRKQELRSFMQKNPLSTQDSDAEWQLVSHDIDEYDKQLRQIIYSPAIIAIVACFEHYIRTGFRIKWPEETKSMAKMRKKICKEIPATSGLFTSDIDNVIEARNIIAHVNGWLDCYDFINTNKTCFLIWAGEAGFREDLGVLVADDASVSHCFQLLEPFFAGFPGIFDENVAH